jgi:segregation and condensation protein B
MRPDDQPDPLPPASGEAPFEPPLTEPAWQGDAPDTLDLDALAPATPENEPVAPGESAPEGLFRNPTSEAPPPLERILEAILFVGTQPLTPELACELLRGLTPEQFHATVGELNQTYRRQGRPYLIQLEDSGYTLALRRRYLHLHDRLHSSTREARLSAAATDVLALVAYRQPVTRSEVDSLRGYESGSLLRQLVRHGLVAVERNEKRETVYRTTPKFLEMFRLRSLDELPQIMDLQQL